jgi:hypothetical protein
MSWKIINEILGLAIADADFYEALRRNPLQAIQEQGFPLIEEEKQAFASLQVDDLSTLSQHLLELFYSEQP